MWFVMAAHHPSPCEAQVVTFGGSEQNLFAHPEAAVVNAAKTTVLHFGGILCYVSAIIYDCVT